MTPTPAITRPLLAVSLALSFWSPAHAGPAEDAQAAFARFFSSFVARNQAEVAGLFAPDAQFYGTQSPDLVTDPAGVLQYFTRALDQPATVVATPLQLTSSALTDSIVLVAGMWRAGRTVDGKRRSPARDRGHAEAQRPLDRRPVPQLAPAGAPGCTRRSPLT